MSTGRKERREGGREERRKKRIKGFKAYVSPSILLTSLLSFSGSCTVTTTDENPSEFTLTSDTVLALSSLTKANITVNETSRLVVTSVAALPDTNPKPYFLSLKDLLSTDRNVDFGKGYSRRFLRRGDCFNISVHNTQPIIPNQRVFIEYKNHIEANLLFKGRIKYWWNNDAETFVFDEKDSVTGQGVMTLLDQHDPHHTELLEEGSQAICVFFPALKGDETHNFSETETSSY